METKGSSPGQTWDSARRQAGNGLLSIIMPAYNLGSSIAANITTVHNLFANVIPFEIIPVDDGSNDSTRSEIKKMAAIYPDVKPVLLPHNMGKGFALKHGFYASKGNYVLFLDGDLDIPPGQVPLFFDMMEREKVDIVIGSKHHPESGVRSYPWHRKMVSFTYYWLICILLFDLPVRDTQTGIKLFKREVLDYALPRMLVKRFAFDIELLAVAHDRGYQFAELPITLNIHGKWPLVRPLAVKQVLLDTLAVFYRLRILKYYQNIPVPKMPAPPPLVSIVIAYPSATHFLDECLDGISRQSYRNYEVILLPDEASGHTWPPNIREIPTGKLLPAEKRNIGINNAKGDVIALIDDDAFPFDNWLSDAVACFSDRTIAAVGGPASTPPNDPYMARLSGDVFANRLVSGPFRYRYEPGMARDVEDYPSCNLIVRTDVMKKAGGFRTDFWPGEDTYLCLDITRKLEMKIAYDPRVEVHHHRRKLFLPHLRQIGRYAMHRGYFAKKFPETSRKMSYALPSLLVLGLVAGGVAASFCPFLRTIYFSALLIYAAVSLLSSFKLNPVSWLFVWAGVVLTHLVYGVRFMAGLLAAELPDERKRFDHPSEIGKT